MKRLINDAPIAKRNDPNKDVAVYEISNVITVMAKGREMMMQPTIKAAALFFQISNPFLSPFSKSIIITPILIYFKQTYKTNTINIASATI